MAAIHFVVSLVLCVLCAEAKMVVMRKSISKKDNWVFISKFAFDVGVGSLDYVVKESTGTRADNKADAHMYFYLDEDWPQVLAAKTCEEKTKVAKAKFPAHVDHKRTVSQFIRPHVWYVVMANCDSDLKMYPRQTVKFKLEFLNPDDSHFSSEEHGLLSVYWLAFTIMVAYSLYLTKVLLDQYRKQDGIHPTIVFVVASFALVLLSTLSEAIHLSNYSMNGQGLPQVDFYGEILKWAGSLTLSLLLLSLSWGWTLRQTTNPLFDGDHGVIIAFVYGILLVLHIILGYLNRDYENAHDKYHDVDTWAGYMLVAIRFGLFIVFAFGIYDTYHQEKNSRKAEFIALFGLFGSIWFLSYPFLVIIAKFFADYLQHKVVNGGELLVQFISMALLSRTFLSKGEYFRVSTLGASILPGIRGHVD